MRVFKSPISRFLRCEDGEVTIAWTVITASLVSMSVIVMSSIGGGTEEVADKTETVLNKQEVRLSY